MRSGGGKRQRLRLWLERERPEEIGPVEWDLLLRSELAPVSESYLRKLLRESGARLHPVIDGVRQGSLDELEESLKRLTHLYEESEPAARSNIRRLVIQAKDHARWHHKEEMVEWILTWLENPGVFPSWVALRRNAIRARPTPPE